MGLAGLAVGGLGLTAGTHRSVSVTSRLSIGFSFLTYDFNYPVRPDVKCVQKSYENHVDHNDQKQIQNLLTVWYQTARFAECGTHLRITPFCRRSRTAMLDHAPVAKS